MKSKIKKYIARPKRMTVVARRQNEVSYDKDFYLWTKKQSMLLKKKEYSEIDFKNLIEEIESLGISDKRSLRSHLLILLLHLLKLNYCSHLKGNSNSWDSSIRNARIDIELILNDSPSLKKEIKKMIPFTYKKAVEKASIETKLKETHFPKECPWDEKEILG